MGGEVYEALADVARAMERFNRALEERAADLRQQGTDQAIIARFMEGTRAIKDSSSIYLSWADYIANGMGMIPSGVGDEEGGEEE